MSALFHIDLLISNLIHEVHLPIVSHVCLYHSLLGNLDLLLFLWKLLFSAINLVYLFAVKAVLVKLLTSRLNFLLDGIVKEGLRHFLMPF